MAEIRVNPTRMELKKLKTRLATARRGHKLLKDKRDELMKQFLSIVRENKELRLRVEAAVGGVYDSFNEAAAVMSPAVMEESLMLPRMEGELTVSPRNMMSVITPVFNFHLAPPGRDAANGAGGNNNNKTDADSGSDDAQSSDTSVGAINYGFAFTSGDLDSAVSGLNAILPDLIRLAEVEKAAQMLADEIEKTRRRVNALEYIMIPQLEVAIRGIVMKLDENERGNTTRLMKVKDMMVAKAITERRGGTE